MRVSQSLNITMLTRSPPLYAEIYKPPATQFEIRSHLDGEEDPPYGRSEAAGDSNGAGGREHLRVAGLVGVDALQKKKRNPIDRLELVRKIADRHKNILVLARKNASFLGPSFPHPGGRGNIY